VFAWQAVLDEIADLNRGDLDAVLAYYTEDVWFEDITVGEPCRGKAAMGAFMRQFLDGFPDLRVTVRHCVAAGDTVTAEYGLSGTHTGVFLGFAPTGRSFDVPAVSIYVHDGTLFTRETVYYDSATMFRQLGLPIEQA
jgi:steroid delta-isomerase-like uncharacterized protein